MLQLQNYYVKNVLKIKELMKYHIIVEIVIHLYVKIVD